MSRVEKLTVTGLRNLVDVAIDVSPRLNIFHGENGSGKTSLLEGIHLLSSGRSFRSAKLDPLITHGKDEAVILTSVLSLPLSALFSTCVRTMPRLTPPRESVYLA